MQKIKLKISDYGYSGEGVGKFEGRTCFVPYTILGEELEAQTLKESSKFLKCQPLKITKPSPSRAKPPCPYFSICGGCDFQHVSYEDELKIKLMLAERQLKKAGFGGEITLHKSPEQYFYRNKIKLFCSGDRLALYRAASNKLVPIDRCLLAEEPINDAISKIQTFLSAKKLGDKIYNVYIRHQGDQTLVNFVFKRKVNVDFGGLQLMLGAKAGIFQTFPKSSPQHVMGIEKLCTNEFGLDCEFDVNAFHQINNSVGEELYKTVAQLVQGDCINAYSGAGVLGAILSKDGRRVFGIEIGQAEHESAERLKMRNNLKNLYNIKGDCAQNIEKFISQQLGTIIVDPPRAGLNESVAKVINNSCVKNLVYISCDIATLVRDIARLGNYKIKQVHLFDMFSRTSSMEILTLLQIED